MPEPLDIFHWRMSAAQHKSAVDQLRREIILAHRHQTPLPVSLVVQLLPLRSEQLAEAAARGSFTFTDDTWSNEAMDELWMEFEDSVLQTFNTTIPRVWSGRVSINGEQLTIHFDSVLEIEIPRLSEMGVGRSSFQIMVSVDVDTDISLTILREVGQTGRDTWIEAKLNESTMRMYAAPKEVTRYSAFDTEDSCAQDENERDWYVYRRLSAGLCFVHKGTIILGGEVAYERLFGPGTKAEADAFERQNCG